MYAPTGRGEKWVMNSEGVVLEYSSEPFYKSDEIIAGINAHYGTSFYQEDDIDKDFTIGETMPNWNAYEKIELALIAINYPEQYGDSYPFGSVKGSTYEMQANGNKIIRASSDGVVVSLWGTPLEGQSLDLVKQKMAENGYPITSVVLIQSSLKLDDSVENWNSYSIINV